MVERNKIAILYEYNENWIGGTYYIENLIKALRTLPDEHQPIIFAFAKSDDDFDKLTVNTSYPWLQRGNVVRRLNIFSRILNKVWFRINQSFLISPYRKDIPVCFPSDVNHLTLPTAKQVYWIPDFQEHFLPGFFSADEILFRKATQQKIVKQGKYIVFSSLSAQHDFNEIYPGTLLHQFVIPFAVSHHLSNETTNIADKYGITGKFFICSNQFWKHKNHLVILQALKELIAVHEHYYIVFTGKEYDYRNTGYFDELKQYCSQNKLNNHVRFLGFIDRGDQLWLMKHSIAVIQPSLFEGWSTVIEDGKSLNVPIIASNIPVHKEQLSLYKQGMLFTADDPGSLVSCMERITSLERNNAFDYKAEIKKFAESFCQMTKKIQEINN